ncbi:MAG TPA: ABC transporter permease [Acidimicrobiales bacterium]
MNSDSLIWWDWVGRHGHDIWVATLEHLQLTLIAVGVGLLLSILLAAISLRWRSTYWFIAGTAGVLYTIPSLALFAFLVTWTGFTTLTAEIGLVSYTLLILLRNIVEGLDGVPPDVKEAAEAMGYRPTPRFFAVDLRLATPAIMTGLRIATVTTIGLVTVTGLIGQGGYGSFIDAGLKRNFSTEVMVGAGLSVVMAIILDGILVAIGWALTPWLRAGKTSRRDRTSRPALPEPEPADLVGQVG